MASVLAKLVVELPRKRERDRPFLWRVALAEGGLTFSLVDPFLSN